MVLDRDHMAARAVSAAVPWRVLPNRSRRLRTTTNSFREIRQPFVDLGESLLQLLLASIVCSEVELPLHLGPREAQRFELTHPLRVSGSDTLACLSLLLLAFFHPLGEARLRVDEPFSSVTHGIRL